VKHAGVCSPELRREESGTVIDCRGVLMWRQLSMIIYKVEAGRRGHLMKVDAQFVSSAGAAAGCGGTDQRDTAVVRVFEQT